MSYQAFMDFMKQPVKVWFTTTYEPRHDSEAKEEQVFKVYVDAPKIANAARGSPLPCRQKDRPAIVEFMDQWITRYHRYDKLLALLEPRRRRLIQRVAKWSCGPELLASTAVSSGSNS